MPLVTILALNSSDPLSDCGSLVVDLREWLEQKGHTAELTSAERPPLSSTDHPRLRGLAYLAVNGVREASGEIVLLVDVERNYLAADVTSVAEPLLNGEADLVVGCSGSAGILSKVLSPIARTVAPWSGLVGVRREVFLNSDASLRPVGERFALEFTQRVEGRRLDVSLPARPGDRPKGWHLDDIRHLKRLADDRLGTLSRLLQFCVVGASGMVVDLSLYAILQWQFKHTGLSRLTLPIIGSSLDLAMAGVISVFVALLWNFSLNRRLTFNDAKKSSIVRQFVTYVLSNALGIFLSLTLRLSLPRWIGFFDRHKLAAAVVGIVASTGVSFTMARWLVFPHDRPDPIEEAEQPRSVSSSV